MPTKRELEAGIREKRDIIDALIAENWRLNNELVAAQERIEELEESARHLWQLLETGEWSLEIALDGGWALCNDTVRPRQAFYAPRDKLGDCVADAWLGVFGSEEASDASISQSG